LQSAHAEAAPANTTNKQHAMSRKRFIAGSSNLA